MDDNVLPHFQVKLSDSKAAYSNTVSSAVNAGIGAWYRVVRYTAVVSEY